MVEETAYKAFTEVSNFAWAKPRHQRPGGRYFAQFQILAVILPRQLSKQAKNAYCFETCIKSFFYYTLAQIENSLIPINWLNTNPSGLPKY